MGSIGAWLHEEDVFQDGILMSFLPSPASPQRLCCPLPLVGMRGDGMCKYLPSITPEQPVFEAASTATSNCQPPTHLQTLNLEQFSTFFTAQQGFCLSSCQPCAHPLPEVPPHLACTKHNSSHVFLASFTPWPPQGDGSWMHGSGAGD